MTLGQWSRPDLERLFELRNTDKLVWREIATHFPGRSLEQCAMAYHYHHDTTTNLLKPEVKRAPRSVAPAPRAIEARLDRERRVLLTHHTITAAVFGDPLPGRSALDRRNSGDAR